MATIAVTLASSDTHVELAIADNGTGFNVQAVRSEGAGLGLVTMEERVRAAGGEVQVASQAGRGTTVRARCPLTMQPAALTA